VTPGEEITVKVLRVDHDTQKISLGLKQLSADPWSTVQGTYEVGQVRTGRVTRLTEFGAFVELEPGVEGLAHASTFAPTGHSKGWSRSVAVGLTAAFEILSLDLEKKRIGVALVSHEVVQDAREVEEVRKHAERADVASPEGFGSLADKLRAALKPRAR
jgi:small subunit ribosomal protein S1